MYRTRFERSLTEIVGVALALGSDHFQLRSVEARSNKEETCEEIRTKSFFCLCCNHGSSFYREYVTKKRCAQVTMRIVLEGRVHFDRPLVFTHVPM